jgi:hypothetical protein
MEYLLRQFSKKTPDGVGVELAKKPTIATEFFIW